MLVDPGSIKFYPLVAPAAALPFDCQLKFTKPKYTRKGRIDGLSLGPQGCTLLQRNPHSSTAP